MKKKFFLILIFIINIFPNVRAQKRNNVWMIGNEVGIDFNKTPPATLSKSPMKALLPKFTSSICDTDGSILFYTDGEDVWNKSNQKLAKKNNWWPWFYYTMPLITIHPGNDSLYLLFCVASNDHSLKMMTLNSYGMGNIVYPAGSDYYTYYTTLIKDASIMVAATSHCNQKDIWVIAHSGNSLNSFLITERGADTIPATSTFDSEILPPAIYDKGNMKFSANGEKMIMPLIQLNKIAVFDFNSLTGRFSNPILLKMPDTYSLGDVEISPDGSKIYFDASNFNGDEEVIYHSIYQMDLDMGSEASIQKSIVKLSPFPDRERRLRVNRSLQLAPDGKIYVTVHDDSRQAHIIEEPNQAGIAATYNLYKLNFQKTLNNINYNYIRSHSFSPKKSAINVLKSNCAFQPVSFSLLFNDVDSVFWNFGDALSGVDNFSSGISARHLYPGPGSYNVSAIIHHPCFADTAATTITVSKDEIVKIPNFLKDTVLCHGNEPRLDATTPFAKSYFWSDDGSVNPSKQISVAGTYEVRAQNSCSVDTRKFTIAYKNCDCKVFVPTAFTPNHDRLNDIFKPSLLCFVKSYEFMIVSRFGDVIFSTSDPSKGWDGNMGPVAADSGTYVWVVRYLDPATKKSLQQQGTVVLIK